MKKKVLFIALVLVLAITGVVMGKANTSFAGVRYIDNANPTTCLSNGTLPSDCSAMHVSDVICRTVQGGFTRTYYQDAFVCVTVFYRYQ